MKKKVKKPKLTAPKEPKKPRKPQKPEEPKEMIVSSGTISIYDGMSLQEIIDSVPENVDMSKTELTLELDYMGCHYNPGIEGHFTYTGGLMKNPHYNRQLITYNKKMKAYEKNLAEYKAAMKEYEKDLEQYKKEKEIFDKVLAQCEIERLEAELSILRGMC